MTEVRSNFLRMHSVCERPSKFVRCKCINKDGRKVIFSFLALPRSFEDLHMASSIHIPGALNAKCYFRYRLCRSVDPAIYRYDERDRIYFQFGHGQSDDNVDRHPGCSLTVTHVLTMRPVSFRCIRRLKSG